MSKRVIKNVNEVVKIIGLKQPILIGGYALEYYKLRKGNDYDFIISKSDFKRLEKIYGESDDKGNIWLDLRGKHGGVDNFIRLYNFDHISLSIKASKEKRFMVASLEDLYILKSLYFIDDPNRKTQKDINLLLNAIYTSTIGWDRQFRGRATDEEIDYDKRIVKH